MDFPRRRRSAPPRPGLLRPARSRAVLFRKSGDRCGEKRRRSPKNFAWIPSRAGRLYVLKSMRLGSAYLGFCLTRFFSTR